MFSKCFHRLVRIHRVGSLLLVYGVVSLFCNRRRRPFRQSVVAWRTARTR
jgi:hypothetical protein